MKIERTKNASRNIIFGVILKLYQILVPFLMRTLMIYVMGVQYLGLSSLFSSILQVLNLVELGVGSAMVYSMYKPIAQDDTDKICALMKLYRIYYYVIGLVIACVGAALTPFIPHLIKSDLPSELNVYVLYILNLAATVLSYWILAYKVSLFQAHQRNDVTSKVTLITSTVQYGLQALVLLLFHSYYLYLIAYLATQLMTNIITAIAADKMYPNYKPKGTLEKEEVKGINKRIRSLFTAKIGSVVVDTADTIVISAFLGLTVLAVYQNYFYILSSIMGFITTVFTACMAGIGNSIIVETQEKNFKDLKKFSFLISWISGFCACCLLCIYQPFMELWVGKEYMLKISAVICLCAYFYIQEINRLLNTYKDAAGIWYKDRFRPLTVAGVNLTLNLIMVNYWGIYGVLISTVVATLVVGMPWILANLFSTIFEKKYLKSYIKKIIYYAFISVLAFAATGIICHFISFNNLILTILLRGIVCCIVPNLIFLLVYRKLPEFKGCLNLLDNMTKGKLKLEQRFTKVI